MWAEFLGELLEYELFNQLIALSMTLVPLVTGLMVAYHFVMRMKAEDEQVAAQHLRSVKMTLMTAAIIISSGQLLYWTIQFTDLSSPEKPCYGFIWKKKSNCL